MAVHPPCGMKDLLGELAIRANMERRKKAQGHMREVFVSQGKQPDCSRKAKESLSGLKYGNSAQTKVLDQKILSVIHVRESPGSQPAGFGFGMFYCLL